MTQERNVFINYYTRKSLYDDLIELFYQMFRRNITWSGCHCNMIA